MRSHIEQALASTMSHSMDKMVQDVRILVEESQGEVVAILLDFRATGDLTAQSLIKPEKAIDRALLVDKVADGIEHLLNGRTINSSVDLNNHMEYIGITALDQAELDAINEKREKIMARDDYDKNYVGETFTILTFDDGFRYYENGSEIPEKYSKDAKETFEVTITLPEGQTKVYHKEAVDQLRKAASNRNEG